MYLESSLGRVLRIYIRHHHDYNRTSSQKSSISTALYFASFCLHRLIPIFIFSLQRCLILESLSFLLYVSSASLYLFGLSAGQSVRTYAFISRACFFFLSRSSYSHSVIFFQIPLTDVSIHTKSFNKSPFFLLSHTVCRLFRARKTSPLNPHNDWRGSIDLVISDPFYFRTSQISSGFMPDPEENDNNVVHFRHSRGQKNL